MINLELLEKGIYVSRYSNEYCYSVKIIKYNRQYYAIESSDTRASQKDPEIIGVFDTVGEVASWAFSKNLKKE